MAFILIAVVAGFVGASLCDWLFMGVLFHERYRAFPEVWRDSENERQKILVAQLYSLMTACGVVGLAVLLGPFHIGTAIAVAVLAWLAGPLPLLLGNHLFIKLDPAVTAAHAAGWLVKLVLIAVIASLIL